MLVLVSALSGPALLSLALLTSELLESELEERLASVESLFESLMSPAIGTSTSSLGAKLKMVAGFSMVGLLVYG